MNEREYEEVSGDLRGLQARLRGEEPPAIAPRTIQVLPRRQEAQTTPDAIPTLRLERADESVSVAHDDLSVIEDAVAVEPPAPIGPDHPSLFPERTYSERNSSDAAVIQMPRRGDDRVAQISERLARLELELTDVLHGLEDAEELLGPIPISLPVEESTGDPLLDLQRLVARRLEIDPGN